MEQSKTIEKAAMARIECDDLFGGCVRVPIREGGMYRYLEVTVPPDCTAMIVCTNDGGGMMPRKLLLPHQLSTDTLRDVIEAHPGCNWVSIVPVRPDEYQRVWEIPLYHHSPNSD